MLPRFYAPELDASASFVTLPVEEARHLTRVLRLGVGDEVAVFDGRGTEFRATVDVAVRETVTLRLLAAVEAPPVPAVQIVVAQAVLKGSSMDDAVRDATMMGAIAIEPLLTQHADVKASFIMRAATVDRWRRIALAAAKQSRRASLPEVHAVRPLDAWIAQPSAEMVLMFVEPSAACESRSLRELLGMTVPTRAAVLLGPEGGWSPSEIEGGREAGFLQVTLGPLTLRAESMPVAALSALNAIWDD
jgi:16S rRNA (uracil1498-N3)-methyltransferase